ncbi:uncharacterized protein PHACADRAFT_190683 [Phanerochaete carnosa HHB-10118-sp]|uniref:Uncharacterized protein n=1 Tax=Phanerochaete carnosa (strain HHB-10118-sp) TaxID=650164 RepID=K5WPW6_PHACS|nr:uncharacterized protein PHACADRAFT_190683 [Phanerochaete carnosa HHB-10118-sp]EKM61510.1 hypothetical protein PHACADRAFT_190683 [Phanerochaete carnosa HHB-10118-sp]
MVLQKWMARRAFAQSPLAAAPASLDNDMTQNIARDVYNASVVPTADAKGAPPAAFTHSPSGLRPAYSTPKPLFAESTGNGELANLLNAIAALCVCEPQHQRVAVSLVHLKDRIVLHIAQNASREWEQSIPKMVHDVWRLLADFARVIGDPQTRSLKAKARGHEAQRRILERLVRHGVEQLRHRVCKHWELLQHTCLRLQAEKVKRGRMYKDFCAVALRIAELREALLVPVPPRDWGTHVAPLLGRFYLAEQKSSVRGVDNMRLFLDQLNMSTDESYALATRLSKYISKCAALIENTNMIMRLASFRTHSPIFGTPHFEVITIPCRSERHSRAGSLSFWKSLSRREKRDDGVMMSYFLHAECALLEYHHNTLRPRSGHVTAPDVPSHVVGTSKTPCHACRILFSTYHTTYSEELQKKHCPLHLHLSPVQGDGSSTKVDSWLPPRLEGLGSDVESRFASHLLEEYRQYRMWTRKDIAAAVT